MSVSVVSPYLQSTQVVEFGNERHTDLIDALLASCQKATMNPRLPGYGRDLQPYFTTEVVSTRTQSQSMASQPQTRPKGRQRRGKEKFNTSSSGSDEETNKTLCKGSAFATTENERLAPSSSPKGQTIKAIHKHRKAGHVAGLPWAGPAFGIAPAACEIPIPSDFLLA